MKNDNLTTAFLALRDKLHRSAIGFLKNDEDAKDAMQDTFFNLWRHGGTQSDAEARNKLFTVLKNVCIDRLRKPRTLPLEEYTTESPAYDPQPPDDIEQLEALITAGLTDIQKRIYTMVIHDGMEYESIARELDMSVEAVRMNMSRARKKIRENYKNLEK